MSASLTSDRASERTAIDGGSGSSSSQVGASADLASNSTLGDSSSNNTSPGTDANLTKPLDTAGKFDVVQDEKVEKFGRKGDRPDGKHELQQEEVADQLPFAWSPKKKWTVLTVIFVVQCSMNCRYHWFSFISSSYPYGERS